MGERKGTNKYYPPDYDPNKGSLNAFLGTHALRERARKIHLGIIIIRFELPYNIWCDGCQNHIGMGVRYNAEKTKLGMYYSTPIYQFRMKCHLCDSHFEIKTDPANLDYVIVSGARRQENRWDPAENEQVVADEKSVICKLASDSMFKLEHGVKDKDKSKELESTIKDLEELKSSRQKDDYSANARLRQIFRKKRKEDQKNRELNKKMNFGVPLLPSNEEDCRMAALLKFSQVTSNENRKKVAIKSVTSLTNAHTHFSSEVKTNDEKLGAKLSSYAICGANRKSFSSKKSKLLPNLGVSLKTKDNKLSPTENTDTNTNLKSIERADKFELNTITDNCSLSNKEDSNISCKLQATSNKINCPNATEKSNNRTYEASVSGNNCHYATDNSENYNLKNTGKCTIDQIKCNDNYEVTEILSNKCEIRINESTDNYETKSPGSRYNCGTQATEGEDNYEAQATESEDNCKTQATENRDICETNLRESRDNFNLYTNSRTEPAKVHDPLSLVSYDCSDDYTDSE